MQNRTWYLSTPDGARSLPLPLNVLDRERVRSVPRSSNAGAPSSVV